MGVVEKVIGGSIAKPIEAIGGVFDALFTSDEERLTRAEAMERIKQKPMLMQIALNAKEAGHRTVFVAGWRPFIGWVCGFGLAWKYIGYDLFAWVLAVAHAAGALEDAVAPPQLSGAGDLIALLIPMLGLGAYRTLEKVKGVAK